MDKAVRHATLEPMSGLVSATLGTAELLENDCWATQAPMTRQLRMLAKTACHLNMHLRLAWLVGSP